MPAAGCSMVARMPRYALTAAGIRSRARVCTAAQNGSSRHVLALFDNSSKRINKQRSGLLIRGFGVQVPGGAPGLTWGFITPGHFYMSVLSPCLLRVCSRARTPQSGTCQKRPIRRPGAAPGSLDQWSRPHTQGPRVHPESPIPIPSRSVQPAGKRHSQGGYVAGAGTRSTSAACQGCAGRRQAGVRVLGSACRRSRTCQPLPRPHRVRGQSLRRRPRRAGATPPTPAKPTSTRGVEQSGGLAPGANVIVYQAPNSDPGFIDAFFSAASQNTADSNLDQLGRVGDVRRLGGRGRPGDGQL